MALVLSLAVTFDSAVYATTTTYLTLNDAGKAYYVSGAGTDVLTFNYVIAAGQNTADLGVTGSSTGIEDAAGNAANLTGIKGNLPGPLQIDTTAPKISSIATSGTGIKSGTGDLGPGSIITLTVNFSEIVNVNTTNGIPTLALSDGGTASYVGGTGTSALRFVYTVGALGSGQNSSDLTLASSNAFELNGATVSDNAGNAPVLTAANNYNPAGTLQIDTTPPTVTAVVTSPTAGEVTTGNTAVITLDMSEKVSVSGSPIMLLNDGGTASYDPTHSTSTALAFDYTVASGQVTTDLVLSGMQLASPSGIADLAGNAANLAGAGANLGLQVNTSSTGTAGPSGGNFTINGTQDLALFGASTASVAFGAGSAGTLALYNSQSFAGTVAGVTTLDRLDLADINFATIQTPTFSGDVMQGMLNVTDGTHTANLSLLGNYIASTFVPTSDGHGGTIITDPPALVAQTQLTQPHA